MPISSPQIPKVIIREARRRVREVVWELVSPRFTQWNDRLWGGKRGLDVNRMEIRLEYPQGVFPFTIPFRTNDWRHMLRNSSLCHLYYMLIEGENRLLLSLKIEITQLGMGKNLVYEWCFSSPTESVKYLVPNLGLLDSIGRCAISKRKKLANIRSASNVSFERKITSQLFPKGNWANVFKDRKLRYTQPKETIKWLINFHFSFYFKDFRSFIHFFLFLRRNPNTKRSSLFFLADILLSKSLVIQHKYVMIK